MSLETYRKKRHFDRTPEPISAQPAKPFARRFVIQKHAASHLHYDLRLEINRTLKSWAVPKFLPLVKGEKRLAIEVEDHPLSYGDFEGVIPKGEYGGGTVMLWDRGECILDDRAPAKAWKAGKLRFYLKGEKIEGWWHLIRSREANQWLLIREHDTLSLPAAEQDRSVVSNRTMEAIAKGEGQQEDTKRKAPPFIEPMLAKPTEIIPKTGDWRYEIKFDGYRALSRIDHHAVELSSRNNKPLSHRFPTITNALSQLGLSRTIIDGEVVALEASGRSSFQLLHHADADDPSVPIYYYAFDLLQHEGHSLVHLPLQERQRRLEVLLEANAPADGPLRLSKCIGQDAARLLPQLAELKLEGLIGKRAGSRYRPGARNGDWIKLKLVQVREFVIGGITPASNPRLPFGAILVGAYNRGKLQFCGKIGSGFDDDTRQSLIGEFATRFTTKCPFSNLAPASKSAQKEAFPLSDLSKCRWLEPELICQAKFTEWTEQGVLRHPVFLGRRSDLEPSEIQLSAK